MIIRTEDHNFDFQAEKILRAALREIREDGGVGLSAEAISTLLWGEAAVVGQKFIERLTEYSGEEVFEKIVKGS
jgi:hypothetical protein